MHHYKVPTRFARAAAILNMVFQGLMLVGLLYLIWKMALLTYYSNSLIGLFQVSENIFNPLEVARDAGITTNEYLLSQDFKQDMSVLKLWAHVGTLEISWMLLLSWLTTAAFFFTIISSFYAACKLLIATGPGINIEEAKGHVKAYQSALRIVAGVTFVSASAFLCGGRPDFAVCVALPLLFQLLFMLPMLFQMRKIEDGQRVKGNEKLDEIVAKK